MKYKVGDKVRIIKEVLDDRNILGSIGVVRDVNVRGEYESVRLYPADNNSRIQKVGDLGWWVDVKLTEIVEFCPEDRGPLPTGVSRCKKCREAITSSLSGYCCDCKPLPVRRGKGIIPYA